MDQKDYFGASSVYEEFQTTLFTHRNESSSSFMSSCCHDSFSDKGDDISQHIQISCRKVKMPVSDQFGRCEDLLEGFLNLSQPSRSFPDNGKPVLCTAISQGNINNLLRCFRDNHNSLDRDPIQGKNAYHYATTQCNHDLFNIFIDNEKVTHGSRGVSLRMLSTCYKNLTPLHWAVIASNLEAFERILTEIWSYSEIVEKIFSMESRISRMNILHLIVDSSSEPLFMKCSFEILRCHKMLHLVEVPWGKFGNSIIHQSVLLNQTSMLGIMVQEVENLMCLNALKETPLVTAAINDCSKSFVVLIDALISREITHSKKPNFVKIRDLASCRCRRKKTFHVGSKGSFSCAQVSKMIESKICDRLDVIKSL